MKIVFKHRWKEVVTVGLIKIMLKQLRDVSDRAISRALHEAGLAWLRRRNRTRTYKVAQVATYRFLQMAENGALGRNGRICIR